MTMVRTAPVLLLAAGLAVAATVGRRWLGRLAAARRGQEVSWQVTIDCPVDEVFRYCRQPAVLEHLVSRHVNRVEALSDEVSRLHVRTGEHSEVCVPLTLTAERRDQLLAWRAGGTPGVCGLQLRMWPSEVGDGTELRARLWWRPGHGLAHHISASPRAELIAALMTLKRELEATAAAS